MQTPICLQILGSPVAVSGQIFHSRFSFAYPVGDGFARRFTCRFVARLRGRAGRAVRGAEAEGRRVVLSGQLTAFDGSAARNSRSLPFRIRGG